MRGGRLRLLAGVAILALLAALGYGDHTDPDGIRWTELAIYLCAAITIAAEVARRLYALAGSPGRSSQWPRSRFSAEKDLSSR